MNIRLCNDFELEKVANLNKEFVEEKICNGITLDTIDYLKSHIVFVVEEKDEIVGYAYGSIKESDRETSYMHKGVNCFYLEEMYIKKPYRNRGVGKKLFEQIEDYAKHNECDNIQVVAVSKSYEKLLKFYIINLDFDFLSAHLIKKLD